MTCRMAVMDRAKVDFWCEMELDRARGAEDVADWQRVYRVCVCVCVCVWCGVVCIECVCVWCYVMCRLHLIYMESAIDMVYD